MFGQPPHSSIFFPGAHNTLVNKEDVEESEDDKEKGGHQDDTREDMCVLRLSL